MRTEESVTTEIRQMVQDKLASGSIVRVEWLTTEILAAKDSIEGEDADFYHVCAVSYVKRIVKRVINRYDAKVETDPQLVLDGFEHLQQGYTVQRDEETVLVPVDRLTDEELEARAQEYEAMAKGCLAHAKELRAFKRMRVAA